MSLSDISSREPVLLAIAEFDRLGREQFLDKYGFGTSRKYWLVHDGKKYDSKAIVGAAHGLAFPDSGPLRAEDFSGGEATVKAKLDDLGFEVVGDRASLAKPAFLMTWKKGHWPHSEILRMISHLNTHHEVTENWRISAHRQSYRGGRVWLLKQGSGEKGIFGVGTIVGDPVQGPKEAGANRTSVAVTFTQLVDPLANLLLPEKAIHEIIPATKLNTQKSGVTITAEQSAKLEELLTGSKWKGDGIGPETSDETPFDPHNLADARKRINRTIAARRGQRAFRNVLLREYNQTCAVTGCEIIDILEAAHIHPYLGAHSNHITNGLLLRSDIHTLFDCGLLTIDPGTMSVRIAPELEKSSYKKCAGRKLLKPKSSAARPSLEALRLRNSKLNWY